MHALNTICFAIYFPYKYLKYGVITVAFGVNFVYKCMAAENRVAKVSVVIYYNNLMEN